MHYTEIFSGLKIENFIGKMLIFFLIFAQNIDCGYTLEQRRRGGSNVYPLFLFWKRNKIGIPLHTSVYFTDMFSLCEYFLILSVSLLSNTSIELGIIYLAIARMFIS